MDNQNKPNAFVVRLNTADQELFLRVRDTVSKESGVEVLTKDKFSAGFRKNF